MAARLLHITALLVVVWLVSVFVVTWTAPPLLAVSGTDRGDLVALDLRLDVQYRLLKAPFNGTFLSHAWEPSGGRLVAVEQAPAGTRTRLRERDGAVHVLGQYGSRGVGWTPDGQQIVVIYRNSFYAVDPASRAAERRPYDPETIMEEGFVLPLNGSQVLLRGVLAGMDLPASFYRLDPATASIEPLTALPCGGFPTVLDVHAATGAVVYRCGADGDFGVRGLMTVADRMVPLPAAPGTVGTPKLSPDAATLFYSYIPSERQGNIVTVEYYLVDLGRGTLQQVLTANALGGVKWIPTGALQHGR